MATTTGHEGFMAGTPEVLNAIRPKCQLSLKNVLNFFLNAHTASSSEWTQQVQFTVTRSSNNQKIVSLFQFVRVVTNSATLGWIFFLSSHADITALTICACNASLVFACPCFWDEHTSKSVSNFSQLLTVSATQDFCSFWLRTNLSVWFPSFPFFFLSLTLNAQHP